MKVIIRRMQLRDVPAVHDLEKSIFRDAWSADSFRAEVANAVISYPCVMEADDNLCGYAVVWFYAGEVHIGNFAIHPARRKIGLGSKLMTHILDKFRDYKMVFLEVRPSNKAALELYRRFGFIETSRRPSYYTDGEEAIVMARKIN